MGQRVRARGKALLGLIPAAVAGTVVSFLLSSGRWGLVGIWVEQSVIGWPTGFADLANVTATSDCLITGDPIEMCDPYGRPFQPYVALPARVLSAANLGIADTGYIGVALAALWIALIGALGTWIAARWQRSIGELLMALAALTIAAIAPPSLLAVERGTLDIVVVALAAVGLLLIAGARARVGIVLGTIALSISVVIKYFAIGVFVAFIAPRRWRVLPLIAAGICTLILLVNFSDLIQARETAKANLPSTTRILFSSTTGLVTLLTEDPTAFFPAEGQVINMVALRILGSVIFATWVAVFLVLLRRIASPPYASWLLITGGGFLLLLPYFLGDSNDYRLIGLLLPLAGVLHWRNRGSARLWFPVTLILFALITGSAMVTNEFGFLMPKPAIFVGDLALAGALGFTTSVWLRAWFAGHGKETRFCGTLPSRSPSEEHSREHGVAHSAAYSLNPRSGPPLASRSESHEPYQPDPLSISPIPSRGAGPTSQILARTRTSSPMF
jgi:hypothetical protein